MSNSFEWIMPIVGIVFLASVMEMVIPHNRLKNLIRVCVMSVLVSALFVPIVAFLTDYDPEYSGFNVEAVVSEDEFYGEMVDNLEKQTERKLLAQLSIESEVDIDFAVIDKKIVYERVEVKLKNGFNGRSIEEVEIVVRSLIDVGVQGVVVYE